MSYECDDGASSTARNGRGRGVNAVNIEENERYSDVRSNYMPTYTRQRMNGLGQIRTCVKMMVYVKVTNKTAVSVARVNRKQGRREEMKTQTRKE